MEVMEMKILKTFVREFSGDTETPITLFYKYVGNEIGFLLESRGEGKTNYSFMGKHPMAILSGNDKLTIDEKGKATDPKILRSVSPMLDQEAKRLVLSMPAWKPARQRGLCVESTFILPVYFHIDIWKQYTEYRFIALKDIGQR